MESNAATLANIQLLEDKYDTLIAEFTMVRHKVSDLTSELNAKNDELAKAVSENKALKAQIKQLDGAKDKKQTLQVKSGEEPKKKVKLTVKQVEQARLNQWRIVSRSSFLFS